MPRLSPSSCDAATGDCRVAIAGAVQLCNSSDAPCTVVLAPGRYRVSCPPGSGAPVRGPPAIDLSGTTALTFGAADALSPAQIDADYIGAGCAAIGAAGATRLTLRNLVLDTERLPFTDATVLDASSDGREVRLAMAEPARAEWNTIRYPWLLNLFRGGYGGHGADALGGSRNDSWDAATGVATLRYNASSTQRASLKRGASVFIKHFENMQAWGVYGWRLRNASLSHVTLLSCGGMGLRCDFCEGSYTMRSCAVRPGAGRPMSSTADGIHFMHHRGSIVLEDSQVHDPGDDCFNTHSNFVLLASLSLAADRTRATYVSETGPGWVAAVPTHIIGERVAFFSRLTLQQLGRPTTVLAATAGFGENATVTFADPIPASVRRYDMFIPLERIASLDVRRSSFASQTRGLIISASPATIEDNHFHIAGTSVLLLNGGCGAYEDYTEGPFSSDVRVAGNSFTRPAPAARWRAAFASRPLEAGWQHGQAAVWIAACRPNGTCTTPTAPSVGARYPLPPCEAGGSTVPPIVPHDGDDGPGRVVEDGVLLDAPGSRVYSDVHVLNNTFVGAAPFVSVGVTAGVVIAENTMQQQQQQQQQQPTGKAEVCVYASEGFNASAAEASNRCKPAAGQTSDEGGRAHTCVVACTSACAAAQ